MTAALDWTSLEHPTRTPADEADTRTAGLAASKRRRRMVHRVAGLVGLAVAAGMLAGCATTPTGPTTAVLPGQHKSLAQFADDDVLCRHFAAGQVEGDAAHANWMQTAIAGGGTLLGAGIGAAAGGGHGALLGGAAGALGGATVGGLKSGSDQTSLQQRYDVAYQQCQSTRGNRVPTGPFSQRPLSADRGLVFR